MPESNNQSFCLKIFLTISIVLFKLLLNKLFNTPKQSEIKMEIQNLRVQLLSMVNGNVEQAKDMERYVLGEVSGVEETMGSAIRQGGSLGKLPDVDCPPHIKPVLVSASAQVRTPKGIRVQLQESSSVYKLPNELLKSVDDFLYSLERNLQKQ